MTLPKIAIDGLWRCLCPAFDPGLLLRPSRNPGLASKFVGRCTSVSRFQKRAYAPRRAPAVPSTSSRNISNTDRQGTGGVISPEPDSNEPSTESLYGQLRVPSWPPSVQPRVDYLVEKRHERPNIRLYTALVASNADPATGSAAAVELLLDEMKAEGIVPDSEVYYAALRVLAVHPDYILRNRILQEMHERWFSVTESGWHDVICGLLREQQLELALEKLQHMQQEHIQIQPWLYDLFLYTLCEVEEFDEALKIMKYRVFQGEKSISDESWFWLLDSASRCYHYEATRYAWKKRIETNYLNPSDGMCTNILNTAARHGDDKMGPHVFHILRTRPSSNCDLTHWEALFETFINSGDLYAAFTTLTAIKRQKLELSDSSIRALFFYLRVNPSHHDKALLALHSIHPKHKQYIPAEAVNCFLEGAIFHKNLDKAMELYREFPTITSDPPSTSTYNILLHGCKDHNRKDLAMFVASEMLTHKVKPDALTYDRLMLVCIGQEDYEDAFRYLGEMDERGWVPRPGTFMAMVKKCLNVGDRRAWALIRRIEELELNMKVKHLRAWAHKVLGPEVKRRDLDAKYIEKVGESRADEKGEMVAVV